MSWGLKQDGVRKKQKATINILHHAGVPREKKFILHPNSLWLHLSPLLEILIWLSGNFMIDFKIS